MSRYQHLEAFCLMQYQCRNCGYEEVIWNSRDGVTPFSLHCPKCHKSGLGSMVHINWNKDRCVPDHVPSFGDRIFIDLSQELALIYSRMKVEQCWAHPEYPMKDHYKKKEHAVDGLMNNFYPGEPYVITI